MEIEIQSVNIPEIEVEITAPCVNVEVGVPMGSVAPIYDGPLTVIPDDFSQTLPVKGKKMPEDVIVERVPYFESTGVTGGIVCNVGG